MTHPYTALPDHAHWRRAIASVAPREVDPVVGRPFTIAPADKVATAGSCFAQHIARYLRQAGFNFWVTETAHPLAPEEVARKYAYGVFTARYGNIYTTRQLLQLFRRAFGQFTPAEDVWHAPGGPYFDPFRPQIQPGGFLTLDEYRADRRRHLACVRDAFSGLDVFVFTLGLTECWLSAEDGAVFPLCPGTAAGEFDPSRHLFKNMSVDEIVADLCEFTDLLRGVNPRARLVLTVSPVPLMATAEPQHVLTSTTYSKAVLRVAAEEVTRKCAGTYYFPAYEIITGAFNRGAYFAEDLRSVTEEGVAHVMRVFLEHYAETDRPAADGHSAEVRPVDAPAADVVAKVVETMCDEEILGASGGRR
jgi:hypothetical protein